MLNKLFNFKIISRCLITTKKLNYGTVTNRESRRFYKEVTFNESSSDANSMKYEINLDKRKLKTPNGNLVQTNSEMLAALIAHEWQAQDKYIRLGQMHLTTLLYTFIDNPAKLTKESIISQIKTYIKTDTILFRENEIVDLMRVQNEKWTPYVDWINERFPELKLTVKYDLSVDDDSNDASEGSTTYNDSLERYLNSFDLQSLIAVNYIIENLKSVILGLALINRRIPDVDMACDLALLETQFQTNKWGEVEW